MENEENQLRQFNGAWRSELTVAYFPRDFAQVALQCGTAPEHLLSQAIYENEIATLTLFARE